MTTNENEESIYTITETVIIIIKQLKEAVKPMQLLMT